MKQRTIIAIVGMSGAGKSEAGEFFKVKGISVLRFGSVIDGELKILGLPWTAENNTKYRHKIREELGMAAVAIKMLPKIEQVLDSEEKVVLDGLYSWEEYKFLKEKLPELLLLCIYARPKIRYDRLQVRKDRPFTKEQARERDIHEIEVIDKGGPIAFSDYLIINEGTKESFQQALETFYKTV